MTISRAACFMLFSGLALAACGLDNDLDDNDAEFRGKPLAAPKLSTGYNLHLASEVRFPPIPPDSDGARGRQLFGLGSDLVSADSSLALFEGYSDAAGREITSNGRSCFSCHRGLNDSFGLPPPPLTDQIGLDDPLFTGINADAAGDPDAMDNLDMLGLVKYRTNRFDPRRDATDPYKRAFGWRKSPPLLNISVQNGFLTDLRGSVLQDAELGAVFAHTQNEDDRFDDLVSPQDANDIAAFLATQFTDSRLAALRDSDPKSELFDDLTDDPYFTVNIETDAQERGREVFDQNCFACHNMPNVFGSVENVEPLANGARTPDAKSWAPAIGRAYNIGVSERNFHGLRFTEYLGDDAQGIPQFGPIVLPLANEDGSVNNHEITFDIGLAMTTGRTVDIGRFKVPQLRDVANNAPFFHDNSAANLEEVIDYFNSKDYNQSADGRKFPIHLTNKQREDLKEFLEIL